MFYNLGCEWNLTLDSFQTNPWILRARGIALGARCYTRRAKLPPRVAFHSWQDTWGHESSDIIWKFTVFSIQPISPLKRNAALWILERLTPRTAQGRLQQMSFALLHLLSLPSAALHLTWAQQASQIHLLFILVTKSPMGVATNTDRLWQRFLRSAFSKCFFRQPSPCRNGDFRNAQLLRFCKSLCSTASVPQETHFLCWTGD